MRKRVPLNAIRAFEAVARNSSVAKAANELCVTPTAVSHQIRLLEDFLQTELFVRRNSRMYLTPEASANLVSITRALDLIDDAVLSMNRARAEDSRSMAIAASASVTSLWLMPRIGKFLEREPDLELNLSTFISRKEAEGREADIRICNWQSQLDCQVEPLFEEEIVPVCAPALAARFGNDPVEVLRQAPLIHVDRTLMGYDGNLSDWTSYFAETGISRSDLAHGPRFNTSSTGVDAARAGVGVLLGRSLLIEQALEKGELVVVGQPFSVRSPYYMMTPWKPESRARLQRFKDWLLESVSPNQMLHAI